MKTWRRYAVAIDPAPTSALIAVVIDDLGIDPAMTRRLAALPGPLTAAFLPGTAELADQVALIRGTGHEMLVHVPMEPLPQVAVGGTDDPKLAAETQRRAAVLAVLHGAPRELETGALMVGDPSPEIRRRLGRALAAFDGYVGVNNHRGSRFTADEAGMRVVMDELKRRGLLYVDSLTTTESVGTRLAREFGVPHAARDVFLDQLGDPAAIRARLADTEAIARRRGTVVAIGHARRETLDCLAAWLPEIAGRGFALAPVSAIVRDNPVKG